MSMLGIESAIFAVDNMPDNTRFRSLCLKLIPSDTHHSRALNRS